MNPYVYHMDHSYVKLIYEGLSYRYDTFKNYFNNNDILFGDFLEMINFPKDINPINYDRVVKYVIKNEVMIPFWLL